MSQLTSVDQALNTFRVLIGGRAGYDHVFVHIKSNRTLAFDLDVARSGLPPKPQISIRMNLRLVQRGRSAWAAGDVTDMDSLTKLFEEALRALDASQDTAAKIAPFNCDGEPMSLADETFAIIPAEEKLNRLVNLSEAATRDLPKAADVSARYSEGHYRELLWQSHVDRPLVHEWTEGQVALTARTEIDGRKSYFSERVHESTYFDLDWSRLARNSAQTLTALLTDRKIDLNGVRFIAQPPVAAELVRLYSTLLNGDNLSNSALADRVGKTVASGTVNIFDDPHFRKKPRSRFWDAEGQRTHRITHILEGVFKTPSVPSAGAMGLAPTAQMRFGDGQTAFALSFHNLILEPGIKDYVDLLRDLDTGAVLTRFDGLDRFDAKTGDFAVKVSGRRLDKGQLADAFAEVELAGNLVDLFLGLASAGRDLTWFGGVAAPSILCENKN